MASTLGDRVGDIDRVNQLAQSARLINAFKRVDPNDQRNQHKKEQKQKEDQSDKLDLTEENEEKTDLLELIVGSEDDNDSGDGHLDIAV